MNLPNMAGRAAFEQGYERVCPWPERVPIPAFLERIEKRLRKLMQEHQCA